MSGKNPLAAFGDDLVAFVEASKAYRRAASLAYNESARVTAHVATCLTNQVPLDLANLARDCEGCEELGKRAAASEVNLKAAEERFFAWTEKFRGAR